ncbi:unannotated protein [freshwater metagenome]|uniref:Unannotated protein n=1 Tax=freshwater metagenome TaxID=449393 RepID=A0A6J6FGK6_9ZZZZ
MPSIMARAMSDGFELFRFIPVKVPVAFGRLGVRSPSKYGKSVNPCAPGIDVNANSPTSLCDTPKMRVAASKIRAALSVQTSGKKRPVASAKPATAPLESWVGVSETAKAVPLVPSEITTSPGCDCRPRAAAALSPAPAAIGIPDVVTPPNSWGRIIRGNITSLSWRSARRRISSR